jgi:hypothetical protein
MRKGRIKLVNNKFIIVYNIKLIKDNGILAKQNYIIKYFINY